MEEIQKEIRERIINGFSINRIPPKKKKWFIEFAKKEFCDDRGMALGHLIDAYTGILASGVEHIEIVMNELANEVELIKQQLNKPKEEEKKVIRKMCDGRKVEN